MRIRNCIFLLFISLLIIHGIAYSDPSPTVKYLMAEELTLFDIGLYKMEEHAEHTAKTMIAALEGKGYKPVSLLPKAEYDWKKNEININFMLFTESKDLKKEGAKEICKAIIKTHKNIYPVTEGGKGFGPHEYFKHKGYIKKNEPATLQNDLLQIMNIQVLHVNNTVDNMYMVNCKSGFIDKSIQFIETAK